MFFVILYVIVKNVCIIRAKVIGMCFICWDIFIIYKLYKLCQWRVICNCVTCTRFILLFYLLVLKYIYKENVPMCFFDVYYPRWNVDIILRKWYEALNTEANTDDTENEDYDKAFLINDNINLLFTFKRL